MTLPPRPTAAGASQAQSVDLAKVKNFLITSLNKAMDGYEKLSPEQRRKAVHQNLAQIYSRTGLQLADGVREKLFQAVLDELSGFGPIQPLLDDPEISEVMVNGPKHVYIERSGKPLALRGPRKMI